MANTHETLADLFTDIGNAIREKTNTTNSIVADSFPEAIGAIATGVNVSSWVISAHSTEQSGREISVQLDTTNTYVVICNSNGSDYSTSYGEHADAQASVFLIHAGKIVFGVDQEARYYRNDTSATYKRLSNIITSNATMSDSGLFTFIQNTPSYTDRTCYGYSVYRLV